MNELEEYEVSSVHFCLSSETDIRSRSVLAITTSDLYIQDRREKRSIAAPGGLLDPRLGPDCGAHDSSCVTCKQKFIDCPGHWAHIELAEPMYNISYLDRLLKVLYCVCFFCGALLIPLSELDIIKEEEERLIHANKWSKDNLKNTRCPRCEARQVKFVKLRSKGLLSVLYQEVPQEQARKSETLYAKDVLRVLRLISDSDCELLGLRQRPESMLFIAFPVPPLSIRPTSMSGRDRRESELTLKLKRIVSHSLALDHARSLGCEFQYQKHQDATQQSINDYLVGPAKTPFQAGSTQRKCAVEGVSSLFQRLKGKEGRVRGNLMGKRVDFSARSVITPDPNIHTNEVACPIDVCMKLTYPERVTHHNYEKLSQLMRAGPTRYPGANYVIRQDQSRLDLRVAGSTGVRLQIGDEVERHLLAGDPVVMNRQPTLHRMNMMGHLIVPRAGSTFGMNTNTCTAYNADFDGDEMNMHVPQSEAARVELLEIGMVQHHIINPKTCGPIIVLIQDAMLGIYLMTQSHVQVSARRLSTILCRLDDCKWPDLRSKQQWSGRELFSFALPAGLYLFKKAAEEQDEDVEIRDGVLQSGTLTKREVNGREGIIRVIHKELGCEAALTFLDKAHTIANAWLAEYGVSIGLSDMLLDEQSEADVTRLRIQEELRLQDAAAQKGRALTETEALKLLNESREKFVNVTRLSAQEHGNRIADTIRSGSKGEYLKLTQMCDCVGTQEIRGRLLQLSVNSGRSLCYAPKQGRDMLSYGFVKSSYVHGLDRGEYILHAAASLEGLMNTALSTSRTGYIQRRLVKAMEDVVVRYDGSVRRSDGSVISPSFGGHGMDPTRMEVQRLSMMEWSWAQLCKTHLWRDIFNTSSSPELWQEHLDLIQLWSYVRKHSAQLQRYSSQMAAAFHAPRLLWEASQRHPHGERASREWLARKVHRLVQELKHHARQQHTEGGILLHQWLLLEFAASKVLVCKWKMTQAAVRWLLARMCYHFCTSAISPGEAVGMITAQALGSDSTQMTLDTFHHCGQKNITLGLPRLNEIVDASVTKRPSLTLRLLPPDQRPRRMQEHLQAFICLTSQVQVQSLLQQMEVLDMSSPVIRAELSIQRLRFVLEDKEDYKKRLSASVLRLQCDDSIVGVAVPMEVFCLRLQQLLGDEEQKHYVFAASDSNDRSRSVIHIRYLQRARAGKGKEKRAKEKLERVRALFAHPKTSLLPISHEQATEGPSVLITDSRAGKSVSEDEDYGEELVISSRALQSELLLLLRGMDPLQSYCNDFKVVCEMLGIEAAREVLRREASSVFQYGGTDVLPAYIDVLVDVMTYSGEVLGVTRTGVTKHQSVGPLMQCSFEITANVLRDAAAAGLTDRLLGVSECIMMGRPARVGTHTDFSLLPAQEDPSYSSLMQLDEDCLLLQPASPVYEPIWETEAASQPPAGGLTVADLFEEEENYSTSCLIFDTIFRSLDPHEAMVSTMAC